MNTYPGFLLLFLLDEQHNGNGCTVILGRRSLLTLEMLS